MHHSISKTEVSAHRFKKFLDELAVYEAAIELHAAQDRFLDAYAIWQRHRSPITIDNLQQAVLALRRLDPSFRFPLPGDIYA